jgi:hypothetical protein
LPREIVKQYMPKDFNAKYPNTRIILDATKTKMQKPSKVDDQRATWSSYKNSNTLKTMIGTRYCFCREILDLITYLSVYAFNGYILD